MFRSNNFESDASSVSSSVSSSSSKYSGSGGIVWKNFNSLVVNLPLSEQFKAMIAVSQDCEPQEEDRCIELLHEKEVIESLDEVNSSYLSSTPLLTATRKGLVRLMHVLIMLGANPLARDSDNMGIEEIARSIEVKHLQENVLAYIQNAKMAYMHHLENNGTAKIDKKRRSKIFPNIPPKEAFFLSLPLPPYPDCDCVECGYASRYLFSTSTETEDYFDSVRKVLDSHGIKNYQINNSLSRNQQQQLSTTTTDTTSPPLFEIEQKKSEEKDEQQEEEKEEEKEMMEELIEEYETKNKKMVKKNESSKLKLASSINFSHLKEQFCQDSLRVFYGDDHFSSACDQITDSDIRTFFSRTFISTPGHVMQRDLVLFSKIRADTERIYRKYSNSRSSELCLALSKYWKEDALKLIKKRYEEKNPEMEMLPTFRMLVRNKNSVIKNSLPRTLYGAGVPIFGDQDELVLINPEYSI